jgi:hypothetical protein
MKTLGALRGRLDGESGESGAKWKEMEHCMSCNSTLKADEKECWACSAMVAEKNPKTSMHARFQTAINFLFIMFAVLTPLALVLPDGYVPSFKRCVVGLIVLGLARSSIQTMTETRKD